MKTLPREVSDCNGALAGEHSLADPLTVHQLAVEDRDEPPRRLHEHGVAHGHDRGDAPLQQLARHRGVRANVGHRGLAGFEEDQRHAVVAHDPGKLLGVDDLGPALLGLGGLPWVLEAEGAQAVFAVVDPVAVEMHDVVGLARVVRPLELVLEGRESGGREELEFGQLAEWREGLDQGTGVDAVVDVGGPFVLRAGADQQDADRRVGGDFLFLDAVGQAAADAHALSTLEQITAIVVDQLPGEREQQRGGLVGLHLLLRGAPLGKFLVHQDGEAVRHAPARALPGFERRAGGRGIHGGVHALCPTRGAAFRRASPVPGIRRSASRNSARDTRPIPRPRLDRAAP